MFYYVEHPGNPEIQVADKDDNLMILTSLELSLLASIESCDGRGIIRGLETVSDLSNKFGCCRRINLVSGGVNSPEEKITTICALV